MGVAIAGCVALAACIAVVLLRSMGRERHQLRPLANARRLTTLPEYVSAKRTRTRIALLTMALLVTIFACATLVAARPTGLPTAAHPLDGGAPEDVMVCIGGPLDEPAVGATLSYFADHVTGFGTQRIGLTSSNRRVVPLTRDYQYARDTFARYAKDTDRRGDLGPFAPAVPYVDYTEAVDDVLALCLTGFPGFDRPSAQRRSLIYVGPGVLRDPDDPRPALFTSDRIGDMVAAADVQLNVVLTGADSPALAARANATGGRSSTAGLDIAARLAEIRDHPPAAGRGDQGAERRQPTESPDVPLAIALLAAVALTAMPVVWRR